MRDAFESVLDRVRIGVHRIDAPGVAGAMVLGAFDAVDRRVAQIDVGRGHIDLRAQYQCTVGMFAVAHFAEQREGFFAWAVAPRAVFARFFECAAVDAHFLGGLLIDVGVAGADQVFGCFVHEAEVIAGVIEVVVIVVVPAEAQPFDGGKDGVDVFLLFLFRIGVVEAHVAGAAKITRQAEIQAD